MVLFALLFKSLFLIVHTYYSNPPLQRPWGHREIRSQRDLHTVLWGVGARSMRLVRRTLGWLMDSGRLPQYGLARRLELEGVGEEE